MRQKNTTGTDYVYGRIDQDVALAYSHAMGRDIPDYNYYIDAPGETKQLDALLDTVRAGDPRNRGNNYRFYASGYSRYAKYP